VPLLDSIRELAQRDPNAYVELYFEATRLLVELDREGYEYLMAGVMVKSFRASGFMQALDQLKEKIEAGDTEGSLERLCAIRDWVQTIENLASLERLKVLVAEYEKATEPSAQRSAPYVM
jgi:hypothetical protein